jgi:dTDP-4-amino-4,6-dideoxygalactose transaminase
MTSKELVAVEKALFSGSTLGNGPYGQLCEEELELFHPGGTVRLVTSGTHALELAAELVRFEPGDEVIVPAFGFVTSALAFVMAGATPVFADVWPDSLCINEHEVRGLINKKTKAVCVINYAGVGGRLKELRQICDDNNLVLIEDNAHGLGGVTGDEKLGNIGHLSTLSFHETKNLSCGEGGAIVINRDDFVERAEVLREKGTNRKNFLQGNVDKYTWMDRGSSWVLGDVLAAILHTQLKRYVEIHERRHRIWSRYYDQLKQWADLNGVGLPDYAYRKGHTAHIFWLMFDNIEIRNDFLQHQKSDGVASVFHYQNLADSPMGKRYNTPGRSFPVSEKASSCLVRLPLFADMENSSIEKVIESCLNFTPGGK